MFLTCNVPGFLNAVAYCTALTGCNCCQAALLLVSKFCKLVSSAFGTEVRSDDAIYTLSLDLTV